MTPDSTSAPTSKLCSTFKSESIPAFNPDVVPLGPDNTLTEGDHLLYMDLPPEVEHICASAMTSQRLAEAARRYAKAEAEIPEYLREFEDVFAKESFDTLLEQKPWDHAIELEPGSKPTNCKVYLLSPKEQVELDAFLGENLRTRRIRPSKSPMASLVFFIKKKDGSLWLVQDYRALNAVTIKNQYPIPLISELITQLCGTRYFTKLDVHWGFNNIWICDGDEWKATFCTNRGLFKPQVMFFGLMNSPATFQTMMNNIF